MKSKQFQLVLKKALRIKTIAEIFESQKKSDLRLTFGRETSFHDKLTNYNGLFFDSEIVAI